MERTQAQDVARTIMSMIENARWTDYGAENAEAATVKILEALTMQQHRDAIARAAFKAGLEAHAWHKDGDVFVGTSGKLLRHAKQEVDAKESDYYEDLIRMAAEL